MANPERGRVDRLRIGGWVREKPGGNHSDDGRVKEVLDEDGDARAGKELTVSTMRWLRWHDSDSSTSEISSNVENLPAVVEPAATDKRALVGVPAVNGSDAAFRARHLCPQEPRFTWGGPRRRRVARIVLAGGSLVVLFLAAINMAASQGDALWGLDRPIVNATPEGIPVPEPVAATPSPLVTVGDISTVTPSATPAEPSAPSSASPKRLPTASKLPVKVISKPSPTSLRAGTDQSIRSVNNSGEYVRHRNGFGYLEAITAQSSATVKQDATFRVVAGLADSRCFSFIATGNRYLRHYAFRIQLNANDGTALFAEDATFCARPDWRGDTIRLESVNYPGRFLRHRGNELWLDYQGWGADADMVFEATTPWS